MTRYSEPEPEFIINDPEMLKIMADSRRIEILRAFRTPMTVKELAKLLKTSPTKLYYHVNLLEENGLIRTVDSHIVSGIIEKVYHVVARQYRISPSLLSGENASNENVERVLATVFDGAKEQLTLSLRHGLIDLHDKNGKDTVLRVGLSLSAEELNIFFAQIEALTERANELSKQQEGPEKQTYELVLAFYPTRPAHFDEESEL